MSEHPNTLYPQFSYKEADYPKQKTVVDYVLDGAAQQCELGQGETQWITNGETGQNCKYSEVEPLTRKVASSLYKRGMRRGDILLYSSHNATHLHIFFIGCWRANGAVRAIYPEESAQRMADVMVECKVKWFLCDPVSVSEITEAIKKVPWPVEIIVFGQAVGCTSTDEIFSDDGLQCPKLEVRENDMALILATSGTTGVSKGCVHTHCGLTKLLDLGLKVGDYGPQVALIMGLQTHLTGSCIPLAYLASGKTLIMLSNITKENIFQAVQTYKPNMAFGFPKYLLYLANDPAAKNFDLTSLRFVLSGGVVITPSFISTMETLPNVRVVSAYGMSEGGMFTATKNIDPATNDKVPVWPNVPDFSSGKLLPGAMLQVRHVETGEVLGAGQQGELCFKSPVICTGYLNRPQDTAKSFPNRWLLTGDKGYYDTNGFVFVVDRVKEIFKYFNNHISPSELENVIQQHPGVDNVCVVGVPDPEGGDTIPRAFVTLKDPRALASDIKKFANDRLASYQHLRGGLIVLHELPIGKSGKYDTTVLKKIQISL